MKQHLLVSLVIAPLLLGTCWGAYNSAAIPPSNATASAAVNDLIAQRDKKAEEVRLSADREKELDAQHDAANEEVNELTEEIEAIDRDLAAKGTARGGRGGRTAVASTSSADVNLSKQRAIKAERLGLLKNKLAQLYTIYEANLEDSKRLIEELRDINSDLAAATARQ